MYYNLNITAAYFSRLVSM